MGRCPQNGFLSTPSARRATDHHPQPDRRDQISIHALREEGDPGLGDKWFEDNQISIHALREEGDYAQKPLCNILWISIHALREEGDQQRSPAYCPAGQFLSTPSARRATFFRLCWICSHRISIHALREEGDIALDASILPILNFYPRPPRGGRRFGEFVFDCVNLISIHALREEGDIWS